MYKDISLNMPKPQLTLLWQLFVWIKKCQFFHYNFSFIFLRIFIPQLKLPLLRHLWLLWREDDLASGIPTAGPTFPVL